MATKPPPRVLETLAAPQHYMPPSAREIRAQAVQRLQTGLFGLAGILLLVGLANIINDRARMAEAANSANAALGTRPAEQTKEDPLADIGVVPSTADTQAASSSPQGTNP
jgi:hypothetical protein